MSQMLPCMPMHQTPNCTFVHVEPLSEFGLLVRAVRDESKDLFRLIFSELGVGVRIAGVVRTSMFRAAIFADAVLDVVFGCAQKQVSGIATRRVIARMTDQVPIWDRAVCQFIREAMRHPRLSRRTDAEVSVAAAVRASGPRPARIVRAAIDFRTEPLNQEVFKHV